MLDQVVDVMYNGKPNDVSIYQWNILIFGLSLIVIIN